MLVLAADENVSVLKKSYCCIIRAFIGWTFILFTLQNAVSSLKLCADPIFNIFPPFFEKKLLPRVIFLQKK